MIEKIDIKETLSAFAQMADVTHVYGENVEGSQGKISVGNFMTKGGIYRKTFSLVTGELLELPYSDGMIIIQNTYSTHEKAVAILTGGGFGTVLVQEKSINFFSEIEGKICVYNTGSNTKYIIKNKIIEARGISVTFIA